MRALLTAVLVAGGVCGWVPAAMALDRSAAYQGLGSWIDRYDSVAWVQPEKTIRALAGRGVRTVFLQTANASHRDALPSPSTLGRFVDSAHRERVRIVAWYAPDLCHLGRDERRSLAAIRFRSSHGTRFDSFALDIESACVHPARHRSKRLLRLSRRLRRAVGSRYPLAAIIPSPRGMQLRAERYWPRFPFSGLHRYYDAFVLMTYFTYRADGPEDVEKFTRQDIAILRRETDDPGVAIHSIGGEAQRATTADVRGFVAAVHNANVPGVSLYDASTTTPAMWRLLRRAVSSERLNGGASSTPERLRQPMTRLLDFLRSVFSRQ
jgi:hypothetical protein